MRKHTVMLSALVAAFASFAAPFTDGGVTYTPNDEVARRQPVVTGVNVTGMVESVAYTKGEVDRRIETNAPVRSVNGMRGNVKLGAREVGALPDNRAYLETDANFVNAVRNVQVKSGDSERVLPPYLHEIEFDSTYPEDAKWYYGQADYSDAGMCSVRRTGGIVERNFDWKFDFMPEFVVRTVAAGGRFASIGVANVGKLLTEADVSNGWSPYYRCLPGHMVDGINESGVFAEVNVVDGEPDWDNPGGDIHPLGAVRWVLDHGTSAGMAASNLAVRVKFPAGWSQNFHYMIADAAQTWIVENGAAHLVGDASVSAVMTNFRLYPTHDTYGEGQERYAILSNPANAITNAWYTNAYRRETNPPWVSDLAEVIAYTNAIFDAWAAHDREFFRDMAIGGKSWWQTVHTSVYDLTNRTLRVAVQETDDWYVFAVPSAGGVKPDAVKEIVEPMIGDATNGLAKARLPSWLTASTEEPRGKTDMVVSVTFTDWTIEPDYGDYRIVYNSDLKRYEWTIKRGPAEGTVDHVELSEKDDKIRLEYANLVATRSMTVDKLARTSHLTAGGLAKFGADGNLVADTSGKGLSQNDYTDADKAEVAKVKDKADEFSEWVPDEDAPSDLIGQPEYNAIETSWYWYTSSGVLYFSPSDTSDIVSAFFSSAFPGTRTFFATRKRVLRTGDAATPQELTDAISTNNPAFVSAVRDTPPDDDTPWGEYGTVGAAIVGIITTLALMAKRGAFAPEYLATATYAAGKVVFYNGQLYQAKAETTGHAPTDMTYWYAISELSDFFSDSNTLLTATIAAKAVPAYSASLTYEVGEIVMRDGVAYKCVTAITTAEEWTAAHWTAATDAEIAARLKGFKDDGSVTDAFAAGLFGKQVAKEAIDGKPVTSAANIPNHGVAVVSGSTGTAASPVTVAVTFAAATGNELRMCELLITGVAEDNAVTVDLPAGTYQFSDGADGTKKADGNHFIFTEYQRGKWFVNRVSTTESVEVA